MAVKRFLETGKIVGTHGVRGEVRVDPWSDSPEFVKRLKHLYFDEGKVPVSLESSRVHKNQVLLKLKGVDTVEQADALRGKVLWLDREEVQLPEGTVFQHAGRGASHRGQRRLSDPRGRREGIPVPGGGPYDSEDRYGAGRHRASAHSRHFRQ